LKLVIFGLTISSSWGNGHATLWRGLCRALLKRGHRVVFFERDLPYYAAHRDFTGMDGLDLVLFPSLAEALPLAGRHVSDADAALVTSYCPDGTAFTDLVLGSSAGLKIFYDLDTPVTLENFSKGIDVPYIGPRGLVDFDLVLSYTGGRKAICGLKEILGARRVVPLYGSVDPLTHYPVPGLPEYLADLSYLGTYAYDRQEALNTLFIQTSLRLRGKRFIIGGSLYPEDFPWTENIFYKRHVPPPEHPPFYCSSKLTLNITRRAMAAMGYCPSGRLFEAAACGVPILSDRWEGLGEFFTAGSEIITAGTTEEAVATLEMSGPELAKIARTARERTLEEHTADRRAAELEGILEDAFFPAKEKGA
jgi:spore maturation protein CgeB